MVRAVCQDFCSVPSGLLKAKGRDKPVASSFPYHIRPARADDAEATARVQIASWRSTYSGLIAEAFLDHLEQQLDERIQARERRFNNPDIMTFVMASSQDYVGGFIDVGANRDKDADYDAELYAIYLLKGWQGFHGGQCLVKTAVQWLIMHHYQTLKVWAFQQNPFRRFYEKLGGILIDERSVTLGTQELREVAYGWPNLDGLIS